MDLEKLFHMHKYGDDWMAELAKTRSLRRMREMEQAFGVYPGSQDSVHLIGGVLTEKMIEDAANAAVKGYGRT